MADNKINTEEIMDQIRRGIKERGYSEDVLEFDKVETAAADSDDYDLHDKYSQETLIRNIDQARDTCRSAPVQYNGNMFKYYVKRIIRKADSIIRFQRHQTNFNLNTAKSLNQIEKYILLNDESPVTGSDGESPLEKQLAFYKNTEELVERLENRVVALEAEVESLRKQLAEK